MLKNLKKRQEGFTIIEVMIVLVIAAVILLIVFLAVPALQRNSRNTQRKNEAAQILSAAGEWSSNKNGILPSTAGDATDILALTKNKNITGLKVNSLTGYAMDTALLFTGQKCHSTGDGVTPGSSRQIALMYQVEKADGSGQNVCAESGL